MMDVSRKKPTIQKYLIGDFESNSKNVFDWLKNRHVQKIIENI